MEELVQKYFDKYMESYEFNDTRKFYSDEEFKVRQEEIKTELREIIKNNREYLLRDSFIRYMVQYGAKIIEEMRSLYNGDKELFMKVIYEYVNLGVFWPHTTSKAKDEMNLFVKTIEDDLKEIFQKAYDGVGVLANDFFFPEKDFWLLRGCLISVLAHCYINNELDQYPAYQDIFLNNTQFILDDIELNHFSLEDENLIDERVISIIKDKQNKPSIN